MLPAKTRCPTDRSERCWRSRSSQSPCSPGVIGQGVMVFIMTATPLSMHNVDGHTLGETARVIQAHVIAMYLPSLAAAPLIKRFRHDQADDRGRAGHGRHHRNCAVGPLGPPTIGGRWYCSGWAGIFCSSAVRRNSYWPIGRASGSAPRRSTTSASSACPRRRAFSPGRSCTTSAGRPCC